MIIAIDFDGTIIGRGPEANAGKLLPHALEVLQELQARHSLVLCTCRTGQHLHAAERILRNNGLEFEHASEHQSVGKVAADYYIDDRALGAPLVQNGFDVPVLDWKRMREILKEKSIL